MPDAHPTDFDLIADLEGLYRELPRVMCKGCAYCCVSPSCTLAEFIYLMVKARQTLDGDELAEAVLAEPQVHPDHEGNLRCAFLKDSRCAIHTARTGACRLFGIPSVSEFGVENMVECRECVEVRGNGGDAESIRRWLRRLVEINLRLYPLESEPFLLTGLNVECWLDIYYDTTYANEFFRNIRACMLRHIDLSQLAGSYRPRTGIREKIDKISAFGDLVDIGDAELLRTLLLSIRDDYPLTGTYFLNEANEYLEAIDRATEPAGTE